jgi:hypothetical protein
MCNPFVVENILAFSFELTSQTSSMGVAFVDLSSLNNPV